MAQFCNPIAQFTTDYLQAEGFADARTRAVGCMGWVWSQWLEGTSAAVIRERVEGFVKRGMQMQRLSSRFYFRALHDLYLLHCAIFGSSGLQLKGLAKRVVDASGYGKYTPRNDGELYASAWSGMLKYWILGNREKATAQAEAILGAYQDSSYRAASKQLVVPWLKGDWKGFVRQQGRDFERLWARGRKDGTVVAESADEVVVDMNKLSALEQLWCWAHCGLACLAARNGVDVATDPFWFPRHALSFFEK